MDRTKPGSSTLKNSSVVNIPSNTSRWWPEHIKCDLIKETDDMITIPKLLLDSTISKLWSNIEHINQTAPTCLDNVVFHFFNLTKKSGGIDTDLPMPDWKDDIYAPDIQETEFRCVLTCHVVFYVDKIHLVDSKTAIDMKSNLYYPKVTFLV